METRNSESSNASFAEQKEHPVEKFFAERNLTDGNRSLNYETFYSVCSHFFPPDEIEKNGDKVRAIFNLFDLDKDGVLKEQEWDTFYNWIRVTVTPVTALIIVDVQNDFIDGSLALRSCTCKQDGADVIEPINRLIRNGRFDKIIYSMDCHPENHISFYENLHLRELHSDSKVRKENAKPFDTVIFAEPHVEQTLWPKHCVMNTWGAELHKDLVILPGSEQVRKGENPELEAYSVFFDNKFNGSMELQTILKKSAVTDIYVCGLAYDICVKATCMDGLRLGYALAVIDDCCRGVDANNIDTAKKLISETGGLITNSEDVLLMVNEGRRSLVMSHQLAKAITSTSFAAATATSSE